MQRVRQQWQAEAIAAALDLFPPSFRNVVESGCVHFFTGDSVFSGLQPYEDASHGRSYREISHILYSGHYKLIETTTIVLADKDTAERPWNFHRSPIVHELGHFIHEVLDFDDFELPNVSWYAEDDDHENFAEAISAWILPRDLDHTEDGKEILSRDDYRCIESFMLDDEDGLWLPSWMP